MEEHIFPPQQINVSPINKIEKFKQEHFKTNLKHTYLSYVDRLSHMDLLTAKGRHVIGYNYD